MRRRTAQDTPQLRYSLSDPRPRALAGRRPAPCKRGLPDGACVPKADRPPRCQLRFRRRWPRLGRGPRRAGLKHERGPGALLSNRPESKDGPPPIAVDRPPLARPDPSRGSLGASEAAHVAGPGVLNRLHCELCLDWKPAQYPCLICRRVAWKHWTTTDTSHPTWFRCDCRDFAESAHVLLLQGIQNSSARSIDRESIAQRTCRDLHTRASPTSHAHVTTSPLRGIGPPRLRPTGLA